MRTWAVPTSLFLIVMSMRQIGCLIKVCQELKTLTFGYVFGMTDSF